MNFSGVPLKIRVLEKTRIPYVGEIWKIRLDKVVSTRDVRFDGEKKAVQADAGDIQCREEEKKAERRRRSRGEYGNGSTF